MEALRIADQDGIGMVGLGARVLLVTAEGEGALAQRIAGFGGQIDHEAEVYSALSAAIDDPAGWDMLVIDCDAIGGLDAGRKAHRMLGEAAARLPVVLVASGCGSQVFPQERAQPIELRAPASLVSLRVGMEHALRFRLGRRYAAH